jgi:hypothetical protein
MLYLKTKAARVKFKKIGGGFCKWWNMWFNLIIRGKSYQCSFSTTSINFYKIYRDVGSIGIAWLSSVCDVSLRTQS